MIAEGRYSAASSELVSQGAASIDNTTREKLERKHRKGGTIGMDLPSTLDPMLAGTTLIALNKKGNDVRSIAAGKILRRLASKCLYRIVEDRAKDYLNPFQIGVAVPKGGEALFIRLG